MLSPGVESQLYKVSIGEEVGRRPDRPDLHNQGKVTEVPGTDGVQVSGLGGFLNLPPTGWISFSGAVSPWKSLFITTAL